MIKLFIKLYFLNREAKNKKKVIPHDTEVILVEPILPVKESNPGLPRDRRRYYYTNEDLLHSNNKSK